MFLLIRFLTFHYPGTMHSRILFLTFLSKNVIQNLSTQYQWLNSTISYLCLEFLLQLEWFWHIQSSLHSRSICNSVAPFTDMLERLHIHTSPLSPVNPAEICNVCNGHPITNDPGAFDLGSSTATLCLLPQPVFEHLVEPFRLCLIPLDAIVDFLWSVPVEMVCLTLFLSSCDLEDSVHHPAAHLHWTKATLHPDEPFHYFPIMIRIIRVNQFVGRIVLLTKIQH